MNKPQLPSLLRKQCYNIAARSGFEATAMGY